MSNSLQGSRATDAGLGGGEIIRLQNGVELPPGLSNRPEPRFGDDMGTIPARDNHWDHSPPDGTDIDNGTGGDWTIDTTASSVDEDACP